MGLLALALVFVPETLAPWVLVAAVGIAVTAATIFSQLPAPNVSGAAATLSPRGEKVSAEGSIAA